MPQLRGNGPTLGLNMKLRMKTPIVCVHVKNMNYVLVINEYKY
jgi:hypothetical protein